MTFRFAIERLSATHQRGEFQCGTHKIDAYFRQTVTQDVKRKHATCFVAREITSAKLAGFYTLSSSNIPLVDIPLDMSRRLPRYPTVPAVLIRWLARDLAFRGQAVGELLLFDAIKRVMDAPIGAHAIFADAVDEQAAAFYRAFGFMSLASKPATLFLPIATAATIVR